MSRRARVIVLSLAFVVGFNVLMWVRDMNELRRMHEYCQHMPEPWPECIELYSWNAYGFLYLVPWIAGDLVFLAAGSIVAVVWIKRRRDIPERPDTA
jgi:hypothetical protein